MTCRHAVDFHRALRTVLALVLILPGCTALREVPRDQYAVKIERKNVRVETREGLRYQFDWARFGADTLTGFHRRDTGGSFEELDQLAIPLDSVSRISTRQVDWYRTGLVGGVGLGAVVAAGLSRQKHTSAPPPPPPCDPCPP